MSDPFDEPDNDPTVVTETEMQVEAEPEVQAEAAPEPEAVPEAQVEETEPSVPQVPIHTLHEARQQNRELRNQMKAMNDQLASLNTLKAELDQQRQQAQAAQQGEQFNQDPLGAIQKDLQALKAQQEAEKTENQIKEQTQQQAQALEATITQDVQKFSQTNPDYPEAVQFMLNSRAEELKFMGFPQDQIQFALQNEAEQLANSAVETGESPAELVYNLARLRGYTAKPKAAAAPSVDSLTKGQAASQTISGTQGDADEVSLVAIEKMSDKEFDEFWEKEMNPNTF